MKPTVPEVLPVVQALYRRNGAGCCWHVVLDDGNTAKHFVLSTVEGGVCGAPECMRLAELLPSMSVTQVTKLSRSKRG